MGRLDNRKRKLVLDREINLAAVLWMDWMDGKVNKILVISYSTVQ